MPVIGMIGGCVVLKSAGVTLPLPHRSCRSSLLSGVPTSLAMCLAPAAWSSSFAVAHMLRLRSRDYCITTQTGRGRGQGSVPPSTRARPAPLESPRGARRFRRRDTGRHHIKRRTWLAVFMSRAHSSVLVSILYPAPYSSAGLQPR